MSLPRFICYFLFFDNVLDVTLISLKKFHRWCRCIIVSNNLHIIFRFLYNRVHIILISQKENLPHCNGYF